jgi:NAD(P)H-quinone oxidoreductase subunit 5
VTLTTSDAWILLLIPLVAFTLIALFHNILWRQGDWIGILCIVSVWLGALAVVANGLSGYPRNIPGERSWEWMSVGDYTLFVGFYVDQMTLVMLVVVTTVALMVNVYSLGYMKGEARYGWFFAVLQLFAFSMLLLVLADNLLMLFVAWELVGVCSYFLIGFYFERRSAAEAAKKAFVTNRIGDVGLLIGMILFWRATGTFNIQEIIEAVELGEVSGVSLIVATMFLFLGPIAKSAQVPLHVWLPDAMEGPTPVSALIHAATMVVAGIYLVARMLPVFEATPGAMQVLLFIGMLTALVGATLALVQSDLKKVIAYSTLSNLGFMMLALGAGSVTAAMFHLMTHAFFKACLFLGAGSVIHSTGHQEMDKLGGLRKYMPLTFITFFIAALANAGVPPLAGFWSKDEVLHAVEYYPIYFVIALVWVFISGVYTARMLAYTFWGEYKGMAPVTAAEADADVAVQAMFDAEPRPPIARAAAEGLEHIGGTQAPAATLVAHNGGHGSHDAHAVHAAHGAHGGGHGHGGTPHESPFPMALPLVILAALAIVAGFVVYENVGRAIGLPGGFGQFVYNPTEGPEEAFHLDYLLAGTGTLAGLLGLFFGVWVVAQPGRTTRIAQRFPGVTAMLENKYYFDVLYQAIIDRIILWLARVVAFFDRKVINDTGVDATSGFISYVGSLLKYTQTGRLPNYAFIIVLGVIVIAIVAFSTRA